MSSILAQEKAKHGVSLRKERRSFAESQAAKLAETRMDELNREQLGSTNRKRMEEAGAETRHLREYGPDSLAAKESAFRFTPGGLADRKLSSQFGLESPQGRQATTAANKLSEAKRVAKRDEGLEFYNTGALGLMSPLATEEMDDMGNMRRVLPSWAEKLGQESLSMAYDDPDGAVENLRQGIETHKEEEAVSNAFANMGEDEKKAYLATLMGETGKTGGSTGSWNETSQKLSSLKKPQRPYQTKLQGLQKSPDFSGVGRTASKLGGIAREGLGAAYSGTKRMGRSLLRGQEEARRGLSGY